MRIIEPLVIVEDKIDGVHWAKKIELFARKCYKSEGKMTDDSYKTFVKKVFQGRNHTGLAEHRFVSVTFVTDRGVSHEGVRHRLAAYLQESSRYCDYEGGVTFIRPPWISPANKDWSEFLCACATAEEAYKYWRSDKQWSPQMARYFLPTGLKTEYVATLNLGSWHNFMVKRTAPDAHPQIRQVAVPLLRYFQERLPMFFDNIPLPVLPYKEAELVENFMYDEVPARIVHQD